jgi:hypothetical protein
MRRQGRQQEGQPDMALPSRDGIQHDERIIHSTLKCGVLYRIGALALAALESADLVVMSLWNLSACL